MREGGSSKYAPPLLPCHLANIRGKGNIHARTNDEVTILGVAESQAVRYRYWYQYRQCYNSTVWYRILALVLMPYRLKYSVLA